jgi:hypothetical protein
MGIKEGIKELKRRIADARNLVEYIEAYRELQANTIDVSPLGIQRTTETRMLAELEGILKRCQCPVSVLVSPPDCKNCTTARKR